MGIKEEPQNFRRNKPTHSSGIADLDVSQMRTMFRN